MDGTFTTNDGVRLSYSTHGAGRPVVFVHGWQCAAWHWEPVAGRLGGALRVVYDQRGHGRSADAPAGRHLHRLAFDLHELIEHLGLDDVTLVGHSMGCAVLWAYHELFGAGRVRAMVLADLPPRMVHEPGSDAEAPAAVGSFLSEDDVAALTRGLRDPAAREPVVRGLFGTMMSATMPEETARRLLTHALRVDGEFAAALLDDYARKDWRPQISRIDVPALVVVGRTSIVPWTGGRWIAEHLPRGRLEVIVGVAGSHMLLIEDADGVADLIAKFLLE
jgi:pimeloyl-ACP methyl ester carboxylesterase